MGFNLGSLGSLFVSLSVDTAQFEGDMGKAATIAQRQSLKIEQAVAAIGPAVATAAIAAAGALAALIKSTIDTGDQLNKMSTRTDFTVERLSELQYAAKLADVEVGQLQTSLGFFNKAIADAHDPTSKQAQLFKALGVDISQGAQPAFDQFMAGIEALPNHETKVAAMRVAFGRAGDSLLAMAGNMAQATEQARKLGIVMSADMARQSEQFKDNMTALNATSGAFAMTVTNEVLPALNRISGRLLDAAEKGEKFKGVLAELARAAANYSNLRLLIPGAPGIVEGLLQPDTDPNTPTPIKPKPPTVNAEMTACAVSGGKWINGKCQHQKPKTAKDDNLVGKQLAEDQEEWNKIMAEASALTDQFNARMRGQDYWENMGMTEEEYRQWIQVIEAAQEYDIRVGQLQAGFDGLGNAIDKTQKKAFDFGFTFTSALEDVLVKGGKARDIVNALGQDLVRMITRQAVTDPLSKFASGLMSNSTIGQSIGGFFKGLIPSFDVGTPYVPRDMLAMVHQGEAIVPAGKNMGGGVVVNMNISTPDVGSFRASRGQLLADMQGAASLAMRRNG